MGRTIRQHYVPKSYLKRFAFDGKRLHTFLISKDVPKIISPDMLGRYLKDISISDVCLAKDYYTINKGNPMALEKEFFQAFAEPKLSSIIDTFESLTQEILNDNISVASIRLSENQKRDLALSAFIQYYRTPRQRHQIENMNTFIKAHHKSSCIKNDLSKDETCRGLDVAYTHAVKTFLDPFLWRIFYSKISSYCLLLRASTNGNFFSSDNPVVMHNLRNKGHNILNVNLYCDDFSLFFPLTPTLMLEYYNPVFFQDAPKMNETISIVDEEYENQVNKYQYINAENCVFSFKKDFSLFLKH